MVDLSVIIESLNDLKAHQISEISEALSERTTTNVETQNIIKLILKSGKSMTYIQCKQFLLGNASYRNLHGIDVVLIFFCVPLEKQRSQLNFIIKKIVCIVRAETASDMFFCDGHNFKTHAFSLASASFVCALSALALKIRLKSQRSRFHVAKILL